MYEHRPMLLYFSIILISMHSKEMPPKIFMVIILKNQFFVPEKRFEVRSLRFEVQFLRVFGGSIGSRFDFAEVREVRGSEFSGSTQH